MIEISELNEWKNIQRSWIGRINTVNLDVHSILKLVYRFNVIPIKMPANVLFTFQQVV